MGEEKGLVVNVQELFFRFTLDVTTDFLLGSDVKSLTTPNNTFAAAFDEVQRIQALIVRSGKANIFISQTSFRKGLGTINCFVNQYIERALRLTAEELSSKTKSAEEYTFLHVLAGFTRDRAVLRDQLVAVLLAGRDTTAGCLSWMLLELARRPEVVRKLRAETLEKVGPEGSRRPTYGDLKNMPYLKNVINESLRLYPVVPFNMRMALKDTTLPRGGGPDGSQPIPILKETAIGYSAIIMQRDRSLYPRDDKFPDPAEFVPERWERWHPKSWDYIPFNAGPRICVGQQFALMEVGYVLCRLFQRYESVESRMKLGGEPRLKADGTLRPKHGVRVAFRKAKV